MPVTSKYGTAVAIILESPIPVDTKMKIANILRAEDVISVKCDYCSEELKGLKAIPAGWLACRIRVNPRRSDDQVYVPGPVACPFHVSQLKNACIAAEHATDGLEH